MKKDSRNDGLDNPAVWKAFGVEWKDIREMSAAYGASEDLIRPLVAKIMRAKDERTLLEQLREELASAVGELEKLTRPQNSALIKAIAGKLQMLVTDEDKS